MTFDSEKRLIIFADLLGSSNKANAALINQTMSFTLLLTDGKEEVKYESAVYFKYIAIPVKKPPVIITVPKSIEYGSKLKIMSIDQLGIVEI